MAFPILAAAGAMAASGLLKGLAVGLFGANKPTVPTYTPLDIGTTAAKTTQANLANLGGAQKLGAAINVWNQDQLTKLVESSLGAGTVAGIKGNIADLVAGKLPSDVAESTQVKSAARAMAGGYAGSGMGRNVGLRDLGLASLQATQTGFDQALQWLAATKAPQYNLASGLIDTSQGLNIAQQENENLWNVEWLRRNVEAMPSKWQMAGAAMLGGLGDAAGSVAGSMFSKAPSTKD